VKHIDMKSYDGFKFGPIQQELLEALPLYAKCTSRLYKPGIGFCCLGVEAEVHEPAPWAAIGAGMGYTAEGRHFFSDLSTERWQALGLRNSIGAFSKAVRYPDVHGRMQPFSTLVEFNDTSGYLDHEATVKFIMHHATIIFTKSA